MSSLNPIDKDMAKAILQGSRVAKGPQTEPRTIEVWYRLNQFQREKGCDNPHCVDVRPRDDLGRKIVTKVMSQEPGQGEHYICRPCFLSGYLSPNRQQ